MWSLWKNLGSNPIAKFPYPCTTISHPQDCGAGKKYVRCLKADPDFGSSCTTHVLRCHYGLVSPTILQFLVSVKVMGDRFRLMIGVKNRVSVITQAYIWNFGLSTYLSAHHRCKNGRIHSQLSPVKPIKASIFPMISCILEDSIRDNRSFCCPILCRMHSSVVKYTSSLLQ